MAERTIVGAWTNDISGGQVGRLVCLSGRCPCSTLAPISYRFTADREDTYMYKTRDNL